MARPAEFELDTKMIRATAHAAVFFIRPLAVPQSQRRHKS